MSPEPDNQSSDDLNILTTIRLKRGTRDRLKDLGKKGEDYDALLVRLMSQLENK